MSGKTLWLRAESKWGERRTSLTPEHAAYLIEHSRCKIHAEVSLERIFDDREYEKAGCILEPAHSWKSAPRDAYILGLKELAEEDSPLEHPHIYFAHAYKGQASAGQVLSRFDRGGGKLFDLEYLVDDQGKRVAAFGYWAGYVGAALGIAAWCRRQVPEASNFISDVTPFRDQSLLVKALDVLLRKTDVSPKVLVIGAKGRCGRGALELVRRVGLKATEWDVQETRGGGPFPEILNHDILVNCVLLQGSVSPFVTQELLSQQRRLSVISDVSCDPTSVYNPIPIYKEATTLRSPVRNIIEEREGRAPLDLVAIDHLPTLLPLESSRDFSDQLFPHLQSLLSAQSLPPVWARAEKLYFEKIAALKSVSSSIGLGKNTEVSL